MWVSSGFDIEKCYYYGWISTKNEIRKQEFQKLKKFKDFFLIVETPYRLKKILRDVINFYSANQKNRR